MEKISLEGPYRKICKHNCVHKEIMERIKSARKELNRFPFPRYAHEALMDILDSLNLGDVHE